eukprot:5533892-Pleurochrysis_carterae.AAC.1
MHGKDRTTNKAHALSPRHDVLTSHSNWLLLLVDCTAHVASTKSCICQEYAPYVIPMMRVKTYKFRSGLAPHHSYEKLGRSRNGLAQRRLRV